MAIRSAEVILVCTYFLAACTDRSASSGPMELRSKKSTITRLLLNASSASLAVRIGLVFSVGPLLACCNGPAAVKGVVSRFSKSKLETRCGLPSSRSEEHTSELQHRL